MMKSEIKSALHRIRENIILDCTNTSLLHNVEDWRPWLNKISDQILPLEMAEQRRLIDVEMAKQKKLRGEMEVLRKQQDALRKQIDAQVKKLEAEEKPIPQRHLKAIQGGVNYKKKTDENGSNKPFIPRWHSSPDWMSANKE